METKNIKTESETPKKRINPTFEALVRLRGCMQTNDPKYAWPK